MEGVYLRIDSDERLLERGKIVRPDFVQAIETHWMAKALVKNGIELVCHD